MAFKTEIYDEDDDDDDDDDEEIICENIENHDTMCKQYTLDTAL